MAYYSVQIVTVAAAIFFSLAYVLYLALLPKPIPGNIPYNRKATSRLLGDTPDFLSWSKKNGSMFGLLPVMLREHNTPIMQVFLRPFRRPWVVISDYRESYDIMSRRTKEFDRSDFFADILSALIPLHHIMMPTGPAWTARRRMLNEVMSTRFLHGVLAKQFHQTSEDLVDLWKLKMRLANGRPFPAALDVEVATAEIVWNANFGSNTRIVKNYIKTLSHGDQLEVQGSPDTPVTFPPATNHPAFDALITLTASAGIALSSPFAPSLIHGLALRWIPYLRSAKQQKDKYILQALNESRDRIAKSRAADDNNTSKTRFTCAVDCMLDREMQTAEKEGRPVIHDSAMMQDETFGLLIAGHETTSTTTAWGLKFLTNHQTVQTRLRAALRAAYPTAATNHAPLTLDDFTGGAAPDLPYLDAVLQEIARCSLTTPFNSRRATVDTVVLGHPIPRGTDVYFINNGPGLVQPALPVDEARRSASSRDAKGRSRAWDDATIGDFDPERWLAEDADGRVYCDLHAGPLLTFGAGPRSCFGRKWAMLELKIMLALIVWNFELLPCPEELSTLAAVDRATYQPLHCYVRLREVL